MNLGGMLKKVFGKPYTSIGPEEAAAPVADGGLLLGVREPAEWRAGHAPGPGTSRSASSLAGSGKCRRTGR